MRCLFWRPEGAAVVLFASITAGPWLPAATGFLPFDDFPVSLCVLGTPAEADLLLAAAFLPVAGCLTGAPVLRAVDFFVADALAAGFLAADFFATGFFRATVFAAVFFRLGAFFAAVFFFDAVDFVLLLDVFFAAI